ncbi:hypothetical protein Kpol_1018p132 [Vanderwaltozyma polyspora DSM 70294]|uniref:PH domain-containing protein n=1 Tax=Vanderwaltozyma polyspora (strain ATCC 22028 / DSM 70294 / BCRC 21397 / CBS 2163 / NBRC 10782 / NRRL Y-8283 / UCD 57-17) TaxID=436907 RepID=A7TDX4_VANPO|nr:uncharacterized protein Kpol_1018p132 [Vanderwaltozyma polyspora DSM 70294]EDO19594.1 hypothetical protein Kpol_1018p132 [Vanderwaltozyma polyspora DSM 70294]
MTDYFSLQRALSSGDASGSDSAVTPEIHTEYLEGIPPLEKIPSNSMSRKNSASSTSRRGSRSGSQSLPWEPSVPIPLQLGGHSAMNSPGVVTPGEGSDSVHVRFVKEFPTDLLVDRFEKWRKILKSLIAYFREVAYAQEQFARINNKLKGNVKFQFLTDLEEGSNRIFDPLTSNIPTKKSQPSTLAEKNSKVAQAELHAQLQSSGSQTDDEDMLPVHDLSSAASGYMKFGSGSVQDVQVILKKYHLSLASHQFKISKDILNAIIPKLEELRKDLSIKIREIKDLGGDFHTNLGQHVETTSVLYNKYVTAVKVLNDEACPVDPFQTSKPKCDPYLLKLQLELQMKRQLVEENYLREAFVNLQSSGMQLEKIVYSRIQSSLQRYSQLIDSEARSMIKNLCNELYQGLISRPPAIEWDHFVAHHPTALMDWRSTEPNPPTRKLADIVYPEMKSSLAKCIRAGYLNKSSDLSTEKNGYFVLTSNFLHQFKNADFFKLGAGNAHHPGPLSKRASLIPTFSLNLNKCELVEATEDKFVLKGKPLFNTDGERPSNNITPPSSAGSNGSASDPSKERRGSKLGKIFSNGGTTSKPMAPQVVQPPVQQITKEQQAYLSKVKSTGGKGEFIFTFTLPSGDNSVEDAKQFRKWVQEIKHLASFSNTSERKKFINERILHRDQTKLKNGKPDLSQTTTNIGPTTTNYSDMDPVAQTMSLDMAGTAKSKAFASAFDEGGNLVTIGERRGSVASNYLDNTMTKTA